LLDNLLLLETPDLRLESSWLSVEAITLTITSQLPEAICPACGQKARRVHSRYARHVADAPYAGIPVRWILRVRRFFCDYSACERTTFAERLPAVVAPRARRTQRLAAAQSQVGLALGGEAGARLAQRLGMGLSPDTLLRLIRSLPLPEQASPRVLGLDDWAWRKGARYGTILVDLETSQIVDLLPDRSSEQLAIWLRQHPSVEIVSRDRAEAYAEGIRQGAPEAIQVADRWHLLKNLADALQVVFVRHAAVVKPIQKTPLEPVNPDWSPDPPSQTGAAALPADGSVQARPETSANQRRRARHQEAHALRAQGWSQRQIAAQLGLCPKTVGRYLRQPVFQPEVRRNRRSRLEPFKSYLRQRVQAGCHNATRLWRELRARGYAGGRTQVRVLVATLGQPARGVSEPVASVAECSLRELVFTVLRAPDQLSALQQRRLAQLNKAAEPIATACRLGQAFAALVRERRAEALADWMKRVEQTGPAELRRFVRGLHQDEAAVRNALSYPWSNGPTEGHINRLKFVKRSMYGRANFDLLRRRLLGAT
jgi:transposase